MLRRLAAFLVSLLQVAILTGEAKAAGFPDVPEGAWYDSAVSEMAQSGWLKGRDDGRFHPEDPMTAAEFVTVVARVAGAEQKAAASSHWAAGWLQAALDRNWYDWDELPPTGEGFDRPITRQLAVKVLMRALLPDARGDYNTQSRRISDFAALNGRYYEPVLAAYQTGVVTGDGNGAFRPLDGLSRAEACVLIYRGLRAAGGQPPAQPQQPDPVRPETPPAPVETRRGGVSENGRLQVIGTQLCNEAGEPVVLRGMSSHGLQWYGQYAGAGAIACTGDYGANVFRLAMYTGEGGYLSNQSLKNDVISGVSAAVANDMYVIIDWHILSDGNPMDHLAEAKAFFTEMAARYKDTPNVIYEICNEPNGTVSWAGQVKPYAQEVVAAIRAEDPEGVILIGSPTWSQDIHLAAADPVAGENLMYTLHFYAGTHGADLRSRIDQAMSQGLPVFVSEWGTSRADGSGGVFRNESAVWLDFLAERGISWCNWSLCDKGETSAALRPGASAAGGWTQADLSESGRFVFDRFAD